MLKAGFARIDITPPFGNDLAGYFVRRLADGTLDPLYANAIAVSSDDDTLLMIAVDYIGIRLYDSQTIRKMIAERTGVPYDHILLAALHQHTAPCLDSMTANPETATQLKDTVFMDALYRRFCDLAQMAMDDRRDATMRAGVGELSEPISFVRRWFTKEGIIKTNPDTDKFTILKRCAESDNSVRVVRFDREGANDIALVNFSTHPDTIGGTKWSADWPGFTRRFVENELDGVSCILFVGTQGDTNHIDHAKPKDQRQHGETKYEHTEYMGRTLADGVIAVWDKTEPVEGEKIFAEQTIVYNLTNTDGIELYDEAAEYDRRYRELTASGAAWNKSGLVSEHFTSIYHARRILSLRKTTVYRPVPLTVMGIGNVALVGFGGEAFTAYSKIAKDLVPDKFMLTAVCANGYEGYFPTAEAFEQGGYEAISSLFTPSLESEIVEALDNMLKKI